jgi:predicted XRE-type DNA-binding protein
MRDTSRTRIKTPVIASSGNVFADLGRPQAEEKKTRIRLAVEINRLIEDSGISQAAAAKLLNLNQPKVSALANYKLEGFSVERLMNLLTALGADIQISIRKKARGRGPGKIHISAA